MMIDIRMIIDRLKMMIIYNHVVINIEVLVRQI